MEHPLTTVVLAATTLEATVQAIPYVDALPVATTGQVAIVEGLIVDRLVICSTAPDGPNYSAILDRLLASLAKHRG